MKEISRRNFIGGAAALGIGFGTMGLAGCAANGSASAESKSEPTGGSEPQGADGVPSFLQEPEPIADDQIAQTIETELAVVGLGVAGVSAARSAAEAGVKVVAIEKCSEPNCRSSQFAAFNTENARAMGIEDIETTELVNEFMIQMSHRSDFRILKNWADHCGEAFDWYASAYDDLIWVHPGDETPSEDKVYVSNKNAYPPYEYGRDHEIIFTGTLSFTAPDKGGQKPVFLANFEKAQATGNVDAYFDCPARQLVKEGDRVVGVIFQNLNDKTYTKVLASKGVVLATGDYVRNDEMVAHYLPWIYDQKEKFTFTYMHQDIEGNFADMGDGHRMGYWVGGNIEAGPHAAMAHGDLGKLGVDAFLQLNAKGERYINEDLTNDHFGSALIRQPGNLIYQIFDSKFPEQLSSMQAGLGTKSKVSQEDIDTIDEWTSAKGDTVDELVANLGVEADVAETMKEQIKRYNDLCAAGKDEDFGKSAERLFALENPPFYAIRYAVGEPGLSGASQDALRCLVTMSGLSTTKDAEVCDADFNVIPGLYAIGNVQGGRFLADYPATIAGASHSIAMTYGYLTGKHIAESA